MPSHSILRAAPPRISARYPPPPMSDDASVWRKAVGVTCRLTASISAARRLGSFDTMRIRALHHVISRMATSDSLTRWVERPTRALHLNSDAVKKRRLGSLGRTTSRDHRGARGLFRARLSRPSVSPRRESASVSRGLGLAGELATRESQTPSRWLPNPLPTTSLSPCSRLLVRTSSPPPTGTRPG